MERLRWLLETAAVGAFVMAVALSAAALGVPGFPAAVGASFLVGGALMRVPSRKWPDARFWGAATVVFGALAAEVLLFMMLDEGGPAMLLAVVAAVAALAALVLWLGLRPSYPLRRRGRDGAAGHARG